MTETPRYRYWGNIKPPEGREAIRAQVAGSPSSDGKTATIRLYSPVDAWGGDWGVSASEFAALLDALGDDVTAIDLLINSPGGDVFEGTTILNQLRAHPAKVNVTVQGIAASIASVIMMAGDTIEMAAGSSTMIHDAAGLAIGNAHDMHAMAGVLDKISDNIAAVYAERAGGEPAAWRAVMSAEQWYSADEAVAAGLADRVTPKLTKDAKAASNRFDLTAFAHAGRENAPPPAMPAARAPQTPAAPLPVAPSTDPKEADAMSDTLLEGLRTQLGLPADADEATVLAANAEALTERADPKDAPPVAAVPAGMTLVDAQQWADVKVMAARGAQAAQRQSADDRDATIAKAIADGKLSRNEGNVTKLKADWDADPELTAKRIADMAVLYPVGPTAGYAGADDTAAASAVFSDDEAAQLAQLAGISKEALNV